MGIKDLLKATHNKQERAFHYISISVVIIAGAYAILPMIIFGQDYQFTIHDGLDGYAGIVQLFHDRKLLFHMSDTLPIMYGESGRYTFITYNLYNLFNCVFGYLAGQICTRIFACIFGFFSMLIFQCYIYKIKCLEQFDIYLLIAIAYTITPIAPNRSIAAAAIPIIIVLFLFLKKYRRFTPITFLAILYPFASNFPSYLVFTIIFWGIFLTWDFISKKKININLTVALVLMSLSSIVVHYNYFYAAIFAKNTNRSLLQGAKSGIFDWSIFRDYLLNGSEYTRGLQGYILLPVLIIGTIYTLFLIKKRNRCSENILTAKVLISGWIFLFSAVFIKIIDLGWGMHTGILLIDGFQWGRLTEFIPFIIYSMLGGIIYVMFQTSDSGIEIYYKWLIALISILLLTFIAGINQKYNNSVILANGKHAKVFLIIWGAVTSGILTGILLFGKNKKNKIYILVSGMLIVQMVYSTMSKELYNDTGSTVYSKLLGTKLGYTFKEFFSEELFDGIKEDIAYNDEKVVAYGYHPSVLIYNGFCTLDVYQSVHSMEYQIKFREIIAPALDTYNYWENYYDTWGGRMYLYGELSFAPTNEKEVAPSLLFINVEALKELGGKYILSRAPIANSDELGIRFVNDYDREDSLYHIYLYSTEWEE